MENYIHRAFFEYLPFNEEMIKKLFRNLKSVSVKVHVMWIILLKINDIKMVRRYNCIGEISRYLLLVDRRVR